MEIRGNENMLEGWVKASIKKKRGERDGWREGTANIIKDQTESLTGEYQAGLRKGTRIPDQIFIIKEILTTYYDNKIPTVILLTNFKKAYNSVNKGK